MTDSRKMMTDLERLLKTQNFQSKEEASHYASFAFDVRNGFKNAIAFLKQHKKSIIYENSLYLPVLKTLTPKEALSGMTYQDLNVPYKMEIAQKKRLETNMSFNCKMRCDRTG